jgi:tRNA (guanine-N7-)-methyltransferase
MSFVPDPLDHDLAEPSSFEGSALYGRRKGKKLRSYHASLVETLLPRLRVDVSRPIDLAGLFPLEPQQIWLEIGFGGGEHLLQQAAEQPSFGLIGCEPFVNGVAKALAGIDGAGLQNLRLHDGDAGQLIDRLPDHSLDRVYLLYPDPWPKRRQRKRRFVSDDMLNRLARVMKPGAELRFATDIDDYAGWTLARILRSPDFVWVPKAAADWLEPWAGWQSTRYEEKALGAGRPPAYFRFIRA